MDNDMILKIIEVVLLIVSFVIGRYVLPKIPKSTFEAVKNTFDEAYRTVNLIRDWAQKFIIMQARFSNASGTEKMDEVVKSIKKILNKYGLDMEDEAIRAVAQEVYENINVSQYESK